MIKRTIISEIESWIGMEKILILKGPRQVGKTTIMKQLQAKLEEKGEQTLYFSVDFELGNELFLSPKKFVHFLSTQKKQNQKIYVFIDEFQYIQNAGIFLKAVFDSLKTDIQLIVSGSSSLEITQNSEFLTGRKKEFAISGITFYEYINFQSKYSYSQYTFSDIFDIGFDIQDIKYHLENYMNFGYYPEVASSHSDKQYSILKEIVATYLSKDISGFMKISEINGFNNLVSILSNQIGSLVNLSELSHTLGIDMRKVKHYMEILEGTYMIETIKPYYTNIRKEISKMPKIYFHNIGALSYFLGKTVKNLDTVDGNIIENFVYNILKEMTSQQSDIHYYRTISKSEIDFVLKDRDIFTLIEVKYRNKTSRFPIAMKNFSNTYGTVQANIIITKDEKRKEGNYYLLPFYILPFVKSMY